MSGEGAAAQPAATLTERVLAGGAWGMAGITAQTGIAFLSSLVVARQLAPTDYAVMALAGALVALVSRLGQVGLAEAIVRERERLLELCHTAFWTLVALATVMALVLVVAAGPLSAFYGEPRLSTALPLLALAIGSTLVASVPRALLARELRLGELNAVDVSRSLVIAAGGVTLALSGAGWWALVLPPAVGAALSLPALAWLARYRPRAVFVPRRLRAQLRFGAGVFAARLLAYLAEDLDYLVLGRYLPRASYGLYYFAYVRARQPYLAVAPALQAPLFAAFSEVRGEPARLARAVVRVARVHFAVLAPLALALALLADPAIPFVFGRQWQPTTPLVRVFALMAVMSAAGGFSGAALLAVGRPWAMVGLNLLRCAAVAGVLGWGVATGRSALAIAGALAATNALAVAFNLTVLWRVLRLGLAAAWRVYGRSLGCLALAAAAWLGAGRVGLRPDVLAAPVYLGFAGALLATVYLGGLCWMNRPLAEELWPWLRARLGRSAP